MTTFANTGPICSTSSFSGDPTTDSSGFLLSTAGSTVRIVTPWASPTDNAAGYTGEIRIGSISGTWYIFVCTNGTGSSGATWERVALATF